MAQPSSPNLLPDGLSEKSAVSLLRHLEWQQGVFSLVFLFADVGPASALLDWVNLRLRLSEGAALQPLDPPATFAEQPEDWLDALLLELPTRSQTAGGLMLMLHRHGGDSLWNAARGRFMMRINERRYLLERDVRCPLLLVLPVAYKEEARRLAPDLWHVRAMSDEVRLAGATAAMGALADMVPAATVLVGNMPGAREADAALEAWRQALAASEADVGKVFMPLASQAIEKLLGAGRLADAMSVARQALGITRQRVEQQPEDAALLRDLSVSLEHFGAVSRAQGDWSGAEAVYRESLSLSRQLVERLGGTPESLRDLSVSLDNVGAVSQAQGDWSGAEAVYRESLSLSRQLVERLGGTPESLRDLSVSLDNVGVVSQKQGDWSGAEAVYRESLSLRRQLVERLGGTPKSLADVVVSLVRLSEVAKAEADTLIREARQIVAQLCERCPQVEKYAKWQEVLSESLANLHASEASTPENSAHSLGQ